MRVLFVSHAFPPRGRPMLQVGGMQRHGVELQAALTNHPALSVTSLVLRASSRTVHAKTALFLAALLRRIPRAARQAQVDLVLCSSMVTAHTALALSRRLSSRGVRMAAVVLGHDIVLSSRLYQRLVRATLRRLDLALPISPATAEACRVRAPRTPLEVIPCGIDPARAAPPVRQSEARARVGGFVPALPQLPEGGLVLLSVGRHVPRKGFRWFVQSVLPRLPEEIHYWLVGSGRETGAIRAAARNAGVLHRVAFLGRLPDEHLGLVYRAADLFVMPNQSTAGDLEGFGIVCLEAGLAGLPVVAAAVDGIPSVVREGENGWLTPPGDAEAFARTIAHAHAHRDRERIVALRERAPRYVTAHFGWDVIGARYVAALERVLEHA